VLYHCSLNCRAGAKKRAGANADDWSVVGYSLAEELDLPGLQRALQHHPLYVKGLLKNIDT